MRPGAERLDFRFERRDNGAGWARGGAGNGRKMVGDGVNTLSLGPLFLDEFGVRRPPRSMLALVQSRLELPRIFTFTLDRQVPVARIEALAN